jgi:hypothetical protein
MRERIQASLLGGGGAACEPLVWGLERLGVSIPTWVALTVVLASTALLLLAAITCAHMAAVWLRKRERGRLGQWLIAGVGSVFFVIGAATILYAFVWFQPKEAIAQSAPPAVVPPSQEPPSPAMPQNPSSVVNNGGIITNNQSGGNNTVNNYGPKDAAWRTQANNRSKFLNALKNAKTETLFIPVWPSKESQNYSGEFEDIFNKLHWKFLHFPIEQRPQPIQKIVLGWRQKKSSVFMAIERALMAAEIPFDEKEFELDSDPNKDVIALDVGVISMTDYQIAVGRPN